MHPLTLDRATRNAYPEVAHRVLAQLGLFIAAFAPVAVRWLPDPSVRVALGAALVVVYFAFALRTRSRERSQLAVALGVFALVWLLNDTVPAFVGTYILHDAPTSNSGNPFASTVGGSVVAQLVETALSVVPVLLFARFAGGGPGATYIRRGRLGWWLFGAAVFFVAFFVFVATIPLRPGSPAQRLFAVGESLSFERFLALSPALLIMALSNGFEEEFLFRGLLLGSFGGMLGRWNANLLQAVVFAGAHLGVTYTPSAAVFAVCLVLPLGLAAGWLTHRTGGLVVSAIFHGAFDIAIFVTFLSAVS